MNNIKNHQRFMQRAIKLAKNGLASINYAHIFGYVIVRQDVILVENWKRIDHFEDLNSKIIQNIFLLSESTIYLTLEPCIKNNQISFIDFILKYNIPQVVIGIRNPCNYTNGLGIKLLKVSGVEVIENILQYECYQINKRFFTFYQKQRPFITLTWTQSLNGIICNNIRSTVNQEYYQQLTAKWRTEETGFLIDSNNINYVILQSKYWYGKTPIIIILDQYFMIPHNHFIYNTNYKFVIFTEKEQQFMKKNIVCYILKFDHTVLSKILHILYKKHIQSLLIETSKVTIEAFIKNHSWDEAKIFIYDTYLDSGIQAPKIIGNILSKKSFLNEQLLFIRSKL